jgi:hypothetical protein
MRAIAVGVICIITLVENDSLTMNLRVVRLPEG